MKKIKRKKEVWIPFSEVKLETSHIEHRLAEAQKQYGLSDAEVEHERKKALSQKIYVNNLYQVTRFDIEGVEDLTIPAMYHLSIRRLDKVPAHNWEHFQRIKNELIGATNEAVELFPSVEREVNTVEHHLWVLQDAKMKYPFGFFQRPTEEQIESPTEGEPNLQNTPVPDSDTPVPDAGIAMAGTEIVT